MITTKTRAKGKGIGVTYNVNYTNEAPLDFTDYQYEYGQGESGVRPNLQQPIHGAILTPANGPLVKNFNPA